MTRPDASRTDPAAEIDARFRWGRQQGHPGYVWPDVPIHAWRACLHEIGRVAGKMLERGAGTGAAAGRVGGHAADRDTATDAAGGHGSDAAGPGGDHPVRLDPPGDTTVEALGVAGFTSGTGPLLGYWLERGAVTADPAVARVFRTHLDHGRRRAALLESELRRAVELLTAAGIGVTAIKGIHTARTYFPDPGTRPATDLDLVVAPADWGRARRVLAEAGYTARHNQSRPRREEWLPPDAPRQLRSIDLTHAGNPYSIDLHDSLDRDFNGVQRVGFGPLTADRLEPWPAVHDAGRALAQPLLLALLAAHASEELHNLTLVRLIELVLVIRTDRAAGRLDWDAFRTLLEETDTTRYVYPALELAERLAPGTLDADVHRTLARSATPRLRRVLVRLRPSTAQRLEQLSLDERFMWAETPTQHLRRAADMLWPGSAGGSLRRLRRIYTERLYRLFRGRIALGGSDPSAPE